MLAGWLWAGGVLAADDGRPYDRGPLTPADFRGQPPQSPPRQAQTISSIRYEYRYATRTVGGVTTIRLTKITIQSLLDREQSWNRRPGDDKLMAHEQGHFDITEACRRQASRYWRRRLPELRLRASSLSEAKTRLQQQLDKEMKPFRSRADLMNRQYDDETKHGTDAEQQARWAQRLEAMLADPT